MAEPPPLRILVVNWLDLANPQSGGAEVHLDEIFGRLAQQGHEVTVLCSGFAGCEPRAERRGYRIHRVGRRYTFSLHARRYAHRQWDVGSFDVIVEDLNKVPLFTPRWGLAPVVLLVHHLFGVTAFSEANPLLAGATWLLERPVPRVFRDCPTIAVSESTREDLGRRGMDEARIQVIPNGIEVADFGRVDAEGRFEVPTFVFLGRIKRYKRIDLVVEAIAALRGRGLRARLLVAGRGDQLDPLHRLADRLGVADDVEFLGFVSEERKKEVLRRSWAHVLTSAKEGWGISNIEAAAAGTPTVASDSPGLRESVVDGETGYLVPHGDVAALTERLASLVEDPARVEALGEGARRFAQRFSWDASARDVLGVLRDAVAPSSRDP